MRISCYIRNSCIAFTLLILLACGGGGDSGGSAPAQSPAVLQLARSAVDFGGVVLDSSADEAIVITNTGGSNLAIRSISTPTAPFSMVADTCTNRTLAASQTCTLTMRFSPTSQGGFTNNISVFSTANSETINLAGTGNGLSVWISSVSASCASTSADVTVTNPRSNALLTSFTGSNFVLKQNGVTQAITSIQNYVPIHVSLVLGLDWSTSTANVIDDIKAAANDFIGRLGTGDELAICKFNGSNHIQVFPTATPPYFIAGDDPAKMALIDEPFALQTGTPLYDALMQAIDRAENGAAGNQHAVIVLTDGADNGSSHTLDQAIAYAVAKGIPIFTIYYVDPALSSFGKTDVLQRLARETGGQYYNSDTADLATIFQQLTNVLSNKYTITYTPTSCPSGTTVTLEVQVDDGTGLWGANSQTVRMP
jgi:VWFA-related protein